MKVFCISGKAGSGKDTFARLFCEIASEDNLTTLVVHNADLLKFICRSYLGWNGEKDAAGRSLLQHIGTDVIRAVKPNYWVDFIADMLTFFNGAWDYVLIPDCRFPNEIERLRSAGFDVMHVHIDRPDFQSGLTEKQMKHASETALDGYPEDVRIINASTIPDFADAIREFLGDVRGNM